MKKLKVALLSGLAAGAIDLIPMIAQGLDWYSMLRPLPNG